MCGWEHFNVFVQSLSFFIKCHCGHEILNFAMTLNHIEIPLSLLLLFCLFWCKASWFAMLK